MTQLATHPVDDPAQLDLFADPWTPLHKPLADAFRDACEAEARIPGWWSEDPPRGPLGWVNPNRVRLALLDHPDYEPRRYAALWGWACGRDGFLDKTTRPAQISGKGSRGNGNKSTVWRRWRGSP